MFLLRRTGATACAWNAVLTLRTPIALTTCDNDRSATTPSAAGVRITGNLGIARRGSLRLRTGALGEYDTVEFFIASIQLPFENGSALRLSDFTI